MSLIESLKSIFKDKPKRLRLEDVKPMDLVGVEWSRFQDKIGFLHCVNNDPQTKKILLSVKWKNYEEANLPPVESLIVSYNDKMFKNFVLLNYHLTKEDKAIVNLNDYDIGLLKERLELLVDDEHYEEAQVVKSFITLKEYYEKNGK